MKTGLLAPLFVIIPLLFVSLNKIRHFTPVEFVFVFSIYTIFCVLFFGVAAYRNITSQFRGSVHEL